MELLIVKNTDIMRELKKVLDLLKGLGYSHSELLDFVNNTDGEVVDGVNYVTGGENLVLPHDHYMLVKANVPLKIRDMRYTLKVDDGNGQIENIWSGNEMSEAIHFEAIAIKIWGKDSVWICDNLQEIMVG